MDATEAPSTLGTSLERFEGYFVDLLEKLERIAQVMERFDNVMNPTLGLAEEELAAQLSVQQETPMFPAALRLDTTRPAAPQQAAPPTG